MVLKIMKIWGEVVLVDIVVFGLECEIGFYCVVLF